MGGIIAAILRGIMNALKAGFSLAIWTIELPFGLLREAFAPGFSAAMAEARSMPDSPDRSAEYALQKSLQGLKEARAKQAASVTAIGNHRTPALDVIEFCRSKNPLVECATKNIPSKVLKALIRLSPEQRSQLSQAGYSDIVAWMKGAEPQFKLPVPAISDILSAKPKASAKPAFKAANDDAHDTGFTAPAMVFG